MDLIEYQKANKATPAPTAKPTPSPTKAPATPSATAESTLEPSPGDSSPNPGGSVENPRTGESTSQVCLVVIAVIAIGILTRLRKIEI